MVFRAECRLEDELRSEAAAVALDRFRHRLVRAADGQELVRAESRWRDGLASDTVAARP